MDQGRLIPSIADDLARMDEFCGIIIRATETSCDGLDRQEQTIRESL